MFKIIVKCSCYNISPSLLSVMWLYYISVLVGYVHITYILHSRHTPLHTHHWPSAVGTNFLQIRFYISTCNYFYTESYIQTPVCNYSNSCSLLQCTLFGSVSIRTAISSITKTVKLVVKIKPDYLTKVNSFTCSIVWWRSAILAN